MSQPLRLLDQVCQVVSLVHLSYNTRGPALQSRPLFQGFDRRPFDEYSFGLTWVTHRPGTP
jgi:hypothetical protein